MFFIGFFLNSTAEILNCGYNSAIFELKAVKGMHDCNEDLYDCIVEPHTVPSPTQQKLTSQQENNRCQLFL